MLSASSRRRWLSRGAACSAAWRPGSGARGSEVRISLSATGMEPLGFKVEAEGRSVQRQTRLFSYGCVFLIDCAEEKRLARTPVEDVRQATTEAALGSANHVQPHSNKTAGRAQRGTRQMRRTGAGRPDRQYFITDLLTPSETPEVELARLGLASELVSRQSPPAKTRGKLPRGQTTDPGVFSSSDKIW